MREIAIVASVAALAGGCVLVTGSTDGYSAAPSHGSSYDAGSDGACAATGPDLTCTAAAGCEAGGVCCLVATSALTIGSVCSSACPPIVVDGVDAGAVQLCAEGTECGDGGACAPYACSFGTGASLGVKACAPPVGCHTP